jgi:outer membrane protein
MWPYKVVIPALLSLALAGCATSSVDMAPRRPDRPWAPRTRPGGAIVPGAPTADSAANGYVLPLNPSLATVPDPLALEERHEYSLPELIDIAQSNNPLTRKAWNDARQLALAAGIAKSAFLPTLTASVVAAYQNINNNGTPSGLSLNGINNGEGVIPALSLQWLLFDFGERKALLQVAKEGSVIANVGFTAAHQQVIHAVSLAYYAQVAARAHLATATRSLANAQTVQTAAEGRYAHGVGTVVEVAQARQATAQAQLLHVKAEAGVQDAYQGLIAAMGISPLTRIQVADIAGRELPAAVTDSIDRIVTEALGRRPDVVAAHAARLASEEQVRAARAELFPKLFVSATGAYNNGQLNVTSLPGFGNQSPTTNLTSNHFNFTAVAGVTVPIYDGGLRLAMLKQAQAAADNAALTFTHTRDEAVHQIVVARNGLQTALTAHEASTLLVAAAQTTFDAALAAYRNGVGSVTVATDAETQLLQAENAESDSYSAALSSAATLALAVGGLGAAPR